MDEDDLADDDVRDILLRGRVVRELTKDPRGIRFVVRGRPGGRGEDVEVVCRFGQVTVPVPVISLRAAG